MLLERIYDEDLAQASYFIGCQAKSEAVVVDARRDIDVYRDLAAKNGMTITAVTETHIHADYLSGSRELAEATGAQLYVSDEGGPDWTYGSDFDGAVRMKHGDQMTLGNITVEAVHTPGDTPSTCPSSSPTAHRVPSPGSCSPATSCLWATSAGPTCSTRRRAALTPASAARKTCSRASRTSS